jgi:hypothetical protein
LQGVVDQFSAPDSNRSLTGKRVAELLAHNFATLDPDGNGITREELVDALAHPDRFSAEAYRMVEMLMQYFNTIANLAEDQEGKETVITPVDMEVMNQFLLHSEMTLEQLDSWISLGSSADE